MEELPYKQKNQSKRLVFILAFKDEHQGEGGTLVSVKAIVYYNSIWSQGFYVKNLLEVFFCAPGGNRTHI